jgi:polyribonucleotide 5'-hydroxyl-kinase
MKLHIFLCDQPRDSITNMAFSLPGLGLPTNTSFAVPSADIPSVAAQVARTEKLGERTEWRFEVAFGKQYTIKLTNGDAELWGTELAPNQTYTFSGYKGAIFTWQGCTLEVLGEAESEYLAGDATRSGDCSWNTGRGTAYPGCGTRFSG